MPVRAPRSTGTLALVFSTLALAMLPGCGSDPAAPEEPTPVNVTVESSNREAAVIGPAGGTVTTTSNTGMTYSLVVPAGALPREVEMAITPVTAIGNLPYAGGMVGAARLEPAGLAFLAPVELTIGTVATPAGGQRLVGFSYEGDGRGIDETAALQTGSEIRVLVSHFSGAGAALADPADLDDSACGEVTPDATLLWMIVNCAPDRDGFFNLMRSRYEYLRQEMQTRSGDVLQEALARYAEWVRLVYWSAAMDDLQDAPDVLANEIEEGNGIAAEKILAGLNQAKSVCDAGDLQWLSEFFEYRALAHAVFERTGVPPALQDESILDGLCASAVMESADLADPLPLNLDRSLDLDFALDINGTRVDAAFAVEVSDPDNLVRTPEGRTDAAGRFTTVVRRLIPEGAAFQIEATLILPLFQGGPLGGLSLSEVPLSVGEQLFRGGNAKVTVVFPQYVVAGVATPLTVHAERLTSSGYQPIEFAVVSFAVDGGAASPDEVIATADGVAATSVTATDGARTVVVDIDVSLDNISLGTKQVQAIVASGGIVAVSRSSDTFATSSSDGGAGCAISHQPPDYDIYTGPGHISLSEQAQRTCPVNGGHTETTSEFVISISDPGLAADGTSAEVVFATSGTLQASSTGPSVATAQAGGSFEFEFDIVDTAMQFEASVERDPTGWGVGRVFVQNRDTRQYAFYWDWTQGDQILTVGNLPPGRYQASFASNATLNSIDLPSASWFLNASIKVTPAMVRATAGGM